VQLFPLVANFPPSSKMWPARKRTFINQEEFVRLVALHAISCRAHTARQRAFSKWCCVILQSQVSI
jgi:hypothetical protein